MKRKGFTLIELLAVIVVLAVIALITTPTILGVIEKSRKSSYKASMYGIVNAADIYLTENLGKVSKNEEIVFTCDGIKCSNSEGDKLSFKGEVPKSGSIYIKGNGTVTVESVYNGRYYANTVDDDIEITEEDTSLTRAELTQLVKSLQQKVNQLEQQVQQSNQNTSSITNLKNQHESDVTSIWNKVGKEDLSSIGNGSISKILISQNELISNLNNIITSNQNSVSNLTNQLNTINTKLDSKANASHTHDDRYYTESEINTKLNSKANSSDVKIISDKISNYVILSNEFKLVVNDEIKNGVIYNFTIPITIPTGYKILSIAEYKCGSPNYLISGINVSGNNVLIKAVGIFAHEKFQHEFFVKVLFIKNS